MAGFGFKDRKVAERLKSIGEKSLLTNPSEQSSPKVNYPITENELILIAPSTGIPAADGDTHYSAICCLYDCEENLQTNEAVISLSDTCKYIRCYNDLSTAIAPYTVFVGKLRKYGMFYVSKILYIDRATTTTPPQVSTGPFCAGTCKWVWSASAQEWTKTIDTCAATTSTTTTDPHTTSTSTTTPCPCTDGIDPEELYLQTSSTTTTTTTTYSGPSTTSTSTTTTSSTTTTTTTTSCTCAYPEFCGTAGGQCVYTNCIPSTYENNPPYCSSTTTSSTSSTTTTSIDCATTTTAAGCSYGCDWTWVNSWVQVVNGCSSLCPCAEPEYVGSACAGVHTACVQTSTTSTIPATCEGICCWWWHTTLGWIYGGGSIADPATCHGCYWTDGSVPSGVSSSACKCPKPTHVGGSCGAVAQTFCGIDSAQTSSTTTSTSTTVYGWQCYTSSTSTSTTTTNLCDQGKCTWIESEGSWVLSANTCPSECPCIEPCCDAVEACAITWTYCIGTSTTTTTTTTSSTTTSTTTTCPASGCLYACSEAGWTAVCDCSDPEVCDPCFTEPCMESIYGTIVVCGCGTTTTSSTTTSTTTTTCGHCSWVCSYVDQIWYLSYNLCPGDCGGCPEPPPIPEGGCPLGDLTQNTSCGTSTTTTSTTTSTTTTCGQCEYASMDGLTWLLTQDECTGACVCQDPTRSPEMIGDNEWTDCATTT